MKVRFVCEVWKVQNDKPKVITEKWYFAKIPIGFGTVADFVAATRNGLSDLRQKEFAQNVPQPVLSEKKGVVIDHQKNARDVSERLLRQQYLRFFQAWDTRQPAEVLRRAFIADRLALGIHTVPEESLDTLCNERGFQTWLSAALQKPGRKLDPENRPEDRAELELKVNWFRNRYYCMSPAELEKTLNEKTGLKLKGDSWRRKAERFGLKSSRLIGHPANPNSLPPG